MLIDVRSSAFFVTNPTANITAASITTPLPTRTTPSGDGVVQMGNGGGMTANGLILVPFGAGSATNTFSLNVYGWRHTLGVGAANQLWVPYVLATFTCTLCTTPGIASTDVNATQLFCGTIVPSIGNSNISIETLSPTGNDTGHIVIDAKGSKFIEVRFGTGSSATSCNCLATRI